MHCFLEQIIRVSEFLVGIVSAAATIHVAGYPRLALTFENIYGFGDSVESSSMDSNGKNEYLIPLLPMTDKTTE